MTAPGPDLAADTSVTSLPYAAELQTVGRLEGNGAFVEDATFRPGERVMLQGVATSTTSPFNPMPYAPLKVWYEVKGSLTALDVVSNLDGRFSVSFTASAPGSYVAWAGHPELTARPIQSQFAVNAVFVSPSQLNLSIARGSTYTVSYTLTNAGDQTLTGVQMMLRSMTDLSTGEAPAGMSVQALTEPLELRAGQSMNYKVQVSASSTASQNASLELGVVSANESEPWATAQIKLSTQTSQPVLSASPTSISTGMNPGTATTQYITISNKGYAPATGVKVRLIPEGNETLPSWFKLVTPTELGELNAGASSKVGVSFSPSSVQADDVYQARLEVTSSNATGGTVPLTATVTTSEVGNAYVHLLDAYEGSTDANGATIYGVNGGTVTFQHATIPSIVYSASTGSDNRGIARVLNMTAGRYNVRATASGHEEASGTLDVRPGVDNSLELILNLATISYDWSVTETTIEDSYTVTLEAQYQTDVPVPVVVLEPAGLKLPDMNVGDELIVEYTLTNYGLVRAEDVKLSMPTSNGFFNFTLLDPVPDALEAKQQLRFRMRVYMHSDGTEGTGATVSCGSVTICMEYAYCNCPSKCEDGPNAVGTSCTSISYGTCTSTPGGTNNTPSGQPTGDGGGTWGPYSPPSSSIGIDLCLFLWGKPGNCDDGDASHSMVSLATGQYSDAIVDIASEADGPDLVARREYTGIGAPGGTLGGSWNLEGTFNRLFKAKAELDTDFSIYQGTEELSSDMSMARFGGMSLWCAGADGGCGSSIGGMTYTPEVTPLPGDTPPPGEEGVPVSASGGSCGGGGGGTNFGPCTSSNIARVSRLASGDWDFYSPGGERLSWPTLEFEPSDFEPDNRNVLMLRDGGGREFVFGPLADTGAEVDIQYPMVGPDNTRLEILSNNEGVIWREPSGDWRKYDLKGRMEAEGDRIGNTLTYHYDTQDRLIEQRSHNNQSRWIRYHYEDSGHPERMTGVSDWRGRSVFYTYNAEGMLASVQDLRGGTTTYSYDANKRIVQKQRPEGDTIHIAYVGDQGQVAAVELENSAGRRLLGKQYQRFSDPSGGSFTRVTTTEGRWYEVYYNTFGQIVKKVDARGTLFSREYEYFDAQGTIKRLSETRQDGGVWTTYRDSLGRVSRLQDPTGGEWNYLYESDWKLGATRPIRVQTPDGTIIENILDGKGNIIAQTWGLGTSQPYSVQMSYNATGNLISLRLPGDAVDTPTYRWTYDTNGDVSSRIQHLDATQVLKTNYSHSYDVNGNRVVTHVNPDGQSWTYTYNDDHRLLSVKNNNTQVLERRKTYDTEGRLLSDSFYPELPALSYVQSQTFEAEGLVATVQRAVESRAHTESLSYDGDGHLSSRTDTLQRITRLLYNGQGSLSSIIDPSAQLYTFGSGEENGGCISCSSGGASNETEADVFTDPRGETVRVERDLMGRIISYTDELDQETRFAYDSMGRVIQKTTPDGMTTNLLYNRLGHLIELEHIKDMSVRMLHYERDARGYVTALYADGNFDAPLYRFTRYQNGWVKSVQRGDAPPIHYRYDSRGLLHEVHLGDGSWYRYSYQPVLGVYVVTQKEIFAAPQDAIPAKNITFSFDGYGRLTGWSDGRFSATNTFDGFGRLTGSRVQLTESLSKSFSYTWDAANRKTSFTDPEGKTFYYEYNATDVLSRITLPEQGDIQWQNFDWETATLVTWPNGMERSITLTADGHLATSLYRNALGQELYSRQYLYDANDRIVEIQDGAAVTFVDYAMLGSLQTVQEGSETNTFEYSETLLEQRLLDSRVPHAAWNYNSRGQLVQRGALTYTYTDAGELSTVHSNQMLIRRYVWTVDHRLERIEDGVGNVLAQYLYDPFGRRVMKEVNGTETWFVYSDMGLIGEYQSNGQLLRSYGWNPTGLWGTSPLWLYEDGKYHYYVHDHLGTPQQLTDDTGTVVWAASYSALGEVTETVTTVPNPLRMGGQYFDAESGLHYNWQRYYDPAEGRYLSEDPIGLNGNDYDLHRYAGGDPLNGFDPLGLWCVGGSAYAGIGGGLSFCMDDGDWGFCADVGFGVGASANVEPYGEVPSSDMHAGASATVGTASAEANINYSDSGGLGGGIGLGAGPINTGFTYEDGEWEGNVGLGLPGGFSLNYTYNYEKHCWEVTVDYEYEIWDEDEARERDPRKRKKRRTGQGPKVGLQANASAGACYGSGD